MATAKAAAPRKAATAPKGAGGAATAEVLRAFTLASTGRSWLVGETFEGTESQVKALAERGFVRG